MSEELYYNVIVLKRALTKVEEDLWNRVKILNIRRQGQLVEIQQEDQVIVKGYIDRQTDRQIERQTDRKIERQTDIQIDRQTDRQIDRKTERQMDRQTDRSTINTDIKIKREKKN